MPEALFLRIFETFFVLPTVNYNNSRGVRSKVSTWSN